MWTIWLIISGIFFVAEILTTGFLIFWFGVGAIFAMIVSLFVDSILIQTIVFIVVSSIFMIFTRPLVNRIVSIKETLPTNIYTIKNKEGYVIDDLNDIDYSGKVKINGELWSAISDVPLKRGTKVKVVDVEGVKLKVESVRTETTNK